MKLNNGIEIPIVAFGTYNRDLDKEIGAIDIIKLISKALYIINLVYYIMPPFITFKYSSKKDLLYIAKL